MVKSNESTSSIKIILYENRVPNIFGPFSVDYHNIQGCLPFPNILSTMLYWFLSQRGSHWFLWNFLLWKWGNKVNQLFLQRERVDSNIGTIIH